MVHKHFIKNAVIFTAMLLIVGVNSAPIMSKAGNDFGVAFSVDGETKFTGSQNKYTSSSVQMSCTDKDIDGSYYYGKVYAIDGNSDPVDVSHGYDCRGRRSYYLCDQCRSLRKDLTPGIFGKHVCILSKITKSMKKNAKFR